MTICSTSLSIVVPVHNEGSNIAPLLNGIRTHVRAPHHVFIVYDRDDDNTLPVVQSLMPQYDNVVLVKNRYGRGFLNAIKTGFEAATDDAVLVLMADMSDDLSGVDTMLTRIDEGYDIVCGSRFMRGGGQIGGLWVKKILSRTAGWFLRHVVRLPTADVTNNFRMYSTRVLRDIDIESDGGAEIGMEILVKAFVKGYRICELPTVWRDRTAGESRFQLRKWLPKYFRWFVYAIVGGLRRQVAGKDMRGA